MAFDSVDLHPENLFKVSADTFHYTFSGPSGLHQYEEIVGISGELMPPSLQFFIKVIQKDIAQKGRKRPALGHSSGCFLQPAVYNNTGPKIPPDQCEDALVLNSPCQSLNMVQHCLALSCSIRLYPMF